MVGIVSESDLVLSDEEADLHLPHYFDIMGGDRLPRLDEGLRGAAQQGLRDQGLGADDRRPGVVERRRRRRDGRPQDRREAPQPPARGRRRRPPRRPRHPGRRAGRARRFARMARATRPDRPRRRRAQLRAAEGGGRARASSSARWSRPTATVTAPTPAPTRAGRRARRGLRSPTAAEAELIGRALSARPAADDGGADAGGARRRARRRGPRSPSGARVPRAWSPNAPAAWGRPARVHVKHDSGMGRLGNRDPARVIALARACAANPNLELAGIWTHFATADEPDSDFFDEQLDRFAVVAEAVRRPSSPTSPSTPPTAPPSSATGARTSTWPAAASPSTASIPFQRTPPSAASRRRSRCTPTSPTSSASPPATAPATAGPGGRRRRHQGRGAAARLRRRRPARPLQQCRGADAAAAAIRSSAPSRWTT